MLVEACLAASSCQAAPWIRSIMPCVSPDCDRIVGDPDDPGTPARAIVFCAEGITTKETPRSHQEYANLLFVLTGEEYASIRFDVLFERIGAALRKRLGLSRTIAVFRAPDGTQRIFTEDDMEPRGP